MYIFHTLKLNKTSKGWKTLIYKIVKPLTDVAFATSLGVELVHIKRTV